MDGLGGRPTPGLETALSLMAQGGDRSRIFREALNAALRASHATHALLLGSKVGDPVVLAAVGTDCSPLETATKEALAGSPARRSDPVSGVNAGALPVWSGSRVVAALGVAGPATTLDPTPLDTAIDLVALTLSRPTGNDAVRTAADVLPRLLDIQERSEAPAALLEAVVGLTGIPTFLCLEENGRLRVAAFRGLEREHLTELVADTGFRSLVKDWRDDEASRVATTLASAQPGTSVGCVPVGVGTWHGLVGVVGTEHEIDDALPVITAAATLTARGLDDVTSTDAARLREQDLEIVLNNLPGPVLVVAADGTLVRANPPAADAFGLSTSFDRGRPVLDRLGSTELRQLVEAAPATSDVEIGSPPRHYLAQSRELTTGDRVLVLTDTSAERENVRLKQDFISVMGHELRTPLTVIKGTLQTVTALSGRMEPEEQAELLGSAARQASHLEYLIEDLLLMSTEANGRPSLSRASANALEIVDDVAKAMNEQAPDRDVEVVPLGGDTSLSTDAARLGQVLRHLVDNGLKHTDGPVTVEIRGTPDAVEMTVADRGPGIFSGDVERMFEPFVQGDSSSTRATGGTGIGLYLARRLVEAMHGRLECDSRMGQGTRFTVRLPRHEPVPRSQEVTATRDHASS